MSIAAETIFKSRDIKFLYAPYEIFDGLKPPGEVRQTFQPVRGHYNNIFNPDPTLPGK